MPRCKGCIDDLCHMTEQTLCGIWVNEAEEAGDHGEDEWGEEYEDETRVDLGGGMVVPLAELMDDEP